MKTFTSAILVTAALLISAASCKKGPAAPSNGGGGTTTTTVMDSVYDPVDPATPASIGFFASGWQPKTFDMPPVVAGTPASGTVTDSLTVDVNRVLVKV